METQKIKNYLGKIYRWGIVGGIALTIGGCLYTLNRFDEYNERHKYLDPSNIQVQSKSVSFKDISSIMPLDYYISDINDDGEADVIHIFDHAEWIADGVESKFYKDKSTKTMTPEIRAAATREMHAENDLAILIAKENYRLQEEKYNPQLKVEEEK